MKIADYGKAITSYIESPTTAQKLQAKEKAQTLGRTFLAEGSEDIVEPSKSMQVDTTTKGLDLFTIDDFKDKAEIYVGAYHNKALPLADIKSALNKFTQKGIDDGTFSADEAIKVVQDLKSYFVDMAQKQRLREVVPEGIGTVEREDFDRGGVAQVKAYVESLPKNTVVTRKLIKDFIEANDVNVNFENLFNKNRPAYVGNFIKDKSITIDASKTPDKFKKARAILNDPKKLREFLKYGNKDGVSIKDIRKKFNISMEEFYDGGLRELFDKDFQTQAVSKIKNKTINNIKTLLNDSEAASFLKKGNVVPDDVLAKLKILPGEAATATVRIGQIYGGNNFGVDEF